MFYKHRSANVYPTIVYVIAELLNCTDVHLAVQLYTCTVQLYSCILQLYNCTIQLYKCATLTNSMIYSVGFQGRVSVFELQHDLLYTKQVFYKHRSANFYPTIVYVIAELLADLPLQVCPLSDGARYMGGIV